MSRGLANGNGSIVNIDGFYGPAAGNSSTDAINGSTASTNGRKPAPPLALSACTASRRYLVGGSTA
eukprot:1230111-Rhodomonas_salina.1